MESYTGDCKKLKESVHSVLDFNLTDVNPFNYNDLQHTFAVYDKALINNESEKKFNKCTSVARTMNIC